MTDNGRINGDSRLSCNIHRRFRADCEYCKLSDKIDRAVYGKEE